MAFMEDILIATIEKVMEEEHLEADLLVDVEEHNEQSNLVEASNVEKEECTLLFAQEEENNSQDEWYLDSGASNHMSGKNELFVELVEGVQGDVRLENSSKLPIKGKGKISICQRTGILQFISNVYYVANFR
ncbi:uncharacterized protein LOC112015854 [Quercus suber]|uniref:uncharacterized protein LOC112015854 n=1 Tax=Quercus suber TaxID=58331 RepID=UPI000CE25E5C|nr:uncharacterized protein LOC112015854 [Quercus suber]